MKALRLFMSSALVLVGTMAMAQIDPSITDPKSVPDIDNGQLGAGREGMLKDGKPVTKGWKSLIDGKTLDGWHAEKGYWEVKDSAIVGDKHGDTPHHHYLLSEKDYSDFELHVDVKMVGYNSGVCIRIAPESYDSVPGYQVDMGEGYWGCLWEEHKRGIKVFGIPKETADKILHKDDWNHYYVRAVGHHITIFFNGVKTADGVDDKGLLSGPLGFQLCHGGNTIASFRNMYIKTKFTDPGPDGKMVEINAPPTKGTAPPVPDPPVP